MNVLYLLSDRADEAAAALVTLRRAQIAQRTDRSEVEPARAYAVVPPSGAAALHKLFTEIAVLPVPTWHYPDGAGAVGRSAFSARRALGGGGEADAVAALDSLIRRWRIDLVHTLTARTRIGAVAAQRARIGHIWQVSEWIGAIARVRFPLRDAELVAWFAAHSAAIIVPSAFSGAIFRAYAAPSLYLLPAPVDPQPFDRPPQHRRAEFGGGASIGLLADLTTDADDPGTFLHAAGILQRVRPAARCVIFDQSSTRQPGAAARRWRRMAARVAPRTAAHPGVITLAAGDDRAAIMGALDVLAVPSPIAPVGLAALEAGAARVPVVGAQSGAIAEIVTADVTGLLHPPGDASALARALVRVIDDPALRAQFGEAARSRLLEYHHSADYADRVLTIYRSALG